MSELIENARRRKELLKHLLLQVHTGEAPAAVRTQLQRLLGEVPYDQVVEVEQELLAEGLPAEEILKFCDIHAEVLRGNVAAGPDRQVPPGHPVHTFLQENRAVEWQVRQVRSILAEIAELPDEAPAEEHLNRLRTRFYPLADLDKHYSRKENLLFPFLEKHGIHGPSKVMWAKDDEVREKIKAGIEALQAAESVTAGELKALAELVLLPALEGVEDMIYREEKILFPMSLDTLSDEEWYAVYRQSPAVGFCLFDPTDEWKPAGIPEAAEPEEAGERIQLPTGSFTPQELEAILNTIPFDLTFVDKDDRVRYFTQGRERIFTRTRAILGRKVQLCHPPGSVHIVQQILDDFRSGKQSRAPFWINFKGRFVHIEYFALRDKDGNYLGTLEVSQDLTEKRKLQGEQRLLTYAEDPRHG
ncbi:MAG: DUF438 domain-containing protein [Acidobacteriota bacterium]